MLDLATNNLILTLSVIWCNPTRHNDIPAAYTKATIESKEDINMYPPNDMTLTEEERAASGTSSGTKLQRSLYGLKQAGRLRNYRLHAQLITIGYARCKTDICLYYKREDSNIAIAGIYVDDLLVTTTSALIINDLFAKLKALEVKDLGYVRKFLGMRFQFQEKGFILDQETFLREYFEANSMTNTSPVSTQTLLHKDNEGDELLDAFQIQQFRTLARGLLWLARCTRPDIAIAIHQMTRRFNNSPSVIGHYCDYISSP